MARTDRAKKQGNGKIRKAYWQQPWVLRVMRGKYSDFEKLLYMRILSFGADGCWMTNETLMWELDCTERPLSRAITKLWKGGELFITGWNGHGRRMIAAKYPGAQDEMTEWYNKLKYMGKVLDMEQFAKKVRLRRFATPPQMTGMVATNDGDGSQK